MSGSTLLRCSRRNAAARSTSEGRWAESTTTSVRSACSTLEKQSSLHFSHKPTADTRPVTMAWQVFLITVCVSMAECVLVTTTRTVVSISDVAPEMCLFEATFPQQRENRKMQSGWAIAEVKRKVKGESSCSPNQEYWVKIIWGLLLLTLTIYGSDPTDHDLHICILHCTQTNKHRHSKLLLWWFLCYRWFL